VSGIQLNDPQTLYRRWEDSQWSRMRARRAISTRGVKRFVIGSGIALALALGACGDEETDESKSGVTGTPPPPAEQTTAPEPESAPEKPDVAVPDRPARKLEIEDEKKGDGATAREGDLVRVHYVGVSQSTGEEFDASYNRGEPFEFELGGGMVIEGWDEGVEGMRVGGRRRLVIPPDKGYGAQGQPPAIGPNETLVFVIELLDVQKGG
jgi:peptidylprolyl isomerase